MWDGSGVWHETTSYTLTTLKLEDQNYFQIIQA